MQGSATRQRAARTSRQSRAGFTFVELLIVVAIMSILSAIAIPAYRIYVLRAKVAESLMFLGDAKISINEFYSRWGRMPADNSEAGLRPSEELRGSYLRSLEVRDGVMVATMALGHDHDHPEIERSLSFRPWVNAEAPGRPIIWSCGAQDPDAPAGYHVIGEVAANPVDSKWLPSICRE
jgi:type IV pilus assembly protein PilA